MNCCHNDTGSNSMIMNICQMFVNRYYQCEFKMQLRSTSPNINYEIFISKICSTCNAHHRHNESNRLLAACYWYRTLFSAHTVNHPFTVWYIMLIIPDQNLRFANLLMWKVKYYDRYYYYCNKIVRRRDCFLKIWYEEFLMRACDGCDATTPVIANRQIVDIIKSITPNTHIK